jgi:hypothetical protein
VRNRCSVRDQCPTRPGGRGSVAFMLSEGDKAPTFKLLDQDGEAFSLTASLKAKVPHLVFFYP